MPKLANTHKNQAHNLPLLERIHPITIVPACPKANVNYWLVFSGSGLSATPQYCFLKKKPIDHTISCVFYWFLTIMLYLDTNEILAQGSSNENVPVGLGDSHFFFHIFFHIWRIPQRVLLHRPLGVGTTGVGDGDRHCLRFVLHLRSSAYGGLAQRDESDHCLCVADGVQGLLGKTWQLFLINQTLYAIKKFAAKRPLCHAAN